MFKKISSGFVLILFSVSLHAGIFSFVADVLDQLEIEPEQDRFHRMLYIKLPLESVEYHWEFSDRKQFLNGKLVLEFTSEGKKLTDVIFSDGKLSNNWEVISDTDEEDEENNTIYFGFQSSTRFWFDNADSARIILTNTESLKGRNYDFTAILSAGKYQSTSNNISLYEDYTYDTAEELANAKAFISIEDWQEKWKFSSRTAQGTGWGTE